jgi:oligopeptide/dipeptide ABC transporter ATP-binding protein
MTLAEPGSVGTTPLDRAAIRGRRQWPLPKLADADAPLLEVNDLAVHFAMPDGKVQAVRGVSFRVDDGEALGIAGESGCGKTTTALSLVRLLPTNASIASGSVALFGIDLVPKTERQLQRYRWREIAIVFQGAMNALNPVLRVRDQIAEPVEERLGLSRDSARKRAGELLELVGIPRKRGGAYPHELSGGMRQRAMIAMALANDPEILIADEPTTALDVTVQAQILDVLRSLQASRGLTTVLITHDLGVVAGLADTVHVMYAGEVVESAPAVDAFHRPQHPYTSGLLESLPRLDRPERELIPIGGAPPALLDDPDGCAFAPRCRFAVATCRAVAPSQHVVGASTVACDVLPLASAAAPTPEGVA